MNAYIVVDGKIERTESAAAIKEAHAAGRKLWVDLGPRSPEADLLLAETFALHPLVIEDIWMDRSIPKIDDFDGYAYLVIHGPRRAPEGALSRLTLWILDIVLGATFVITHHDDPELAEAVPRALAKDPSILANGPAWLVHRLLDHVVDRFLPVGDRLGERIDEVERAVIDNAASARDRELTPTIFGLKRSIQALCRIEGHQKEILRRFARGEVSGIPKEALPYFRDVADHFVRVAELADSYRDTVLNTLDAHFSVQSNVMNQAVKRLTLMSTVLLPLNLLAGIYGMNFKYMPELSWEFGYPMALGLMVVVATGVLLWFRHKRWL